MLAAGELVVKVPEQLTVSGTTVSMADLCSVENGTEADREILRKIKLGAAPPPGQTRHVKRSYLEFILKQHQFSGPAQLAMGETVTIKVAAVCITAAAIKEKINNEAPPRKPFIIKQWIEVFNPPEAVWLRKADWEMKVEPVGGWPERGPVLLRLAFTGGPESRVINLKAKIRNTALAFKTKRNLPARSRLAAEDFERSEIELTTGREVIGNFPDNYRSKTNLKEGAVLQNSQVEPTPLVSKNSAISVVIADKAFRIELTGIAKEEGWLGDMITILNPVGKKTFKGKVIGSNMAEVTVP